MKITVTRDPIVNTAQVTGLFLLVKELPKDEPTQPLWGLQVFCGFEQRVARFHSPLQTSNSEVHGVTLCGAMFAGRAFAESEAIRIAAIEQPEHIDSFTLKVMSVDEYHALIERIFPGMLQTYPV